MALKRIVKKEEFEKLPDLIKAEYKKSDSGDDYILDSDDKDYKQQLDEFRSNNRALHAEKERLQALADKYRGVDLDKYAEAMAALTEIDKSKEADLIKAGKIDQVVQMRTQAMKDELEKQIRAKDTALQATTAERDTYKKSLGGYVIDGLAQQHLAKVGKVRPSAVPDVLARARSIWSVDEKGQAITKEYGPSGNTLTWEEWAQGLLSSAPHLFEASGGGGAGGGDKGAGGGGKKTISGNDPLEFGRNIEGIAKGTVLVAGASAE